MSKKTISKRTMSKRTKRRSDRKPQLKSHQPSSHSDGWLNQKILWTKVELIQQHWSMAFTIEVDDLVYVTLCQDEATVIQSKFLQATRQSTTALEHINKQGRLVATHPIRSEHLVLLKHDMVHTYFKEIEKVSKLKNLRCVCIIESYADATALEKLLELWRLSQLS